jgi:hypothetical protein
MATLFGSLGTKSLSGGGKLVYNIYENPNSHVADHFSLQFVYFNGLSSCPLQGEFVQDKHRIKKSCTWGYKHALVILGLKLGQFRNLRG